MPGQHENSMFAYEETVKERAARREAVLGVFMTADRPLTDREVMIRLGFNDMNAVRPRITEMTTDGTLVECSKVRDTVTKRLVRGSRIRIPEQQERFI